MLKCAASATDPCLPLQTLSIVVHCIQFGVLQRPLIPEDIKDGRTRGRFRAVSAGAGESRDGEVRWVRLEGPNYDWQDWGDWLGDRGVQSVHGHYASKMPLACIHTHTQTHNPIHAHTRTQTLLYTHLICLIWLNMFTTFTMCVHVHACM